MKEPLNSISEEELEISGSSSSKGFNFRPILRTLLRKAWLIAGVTSLTTFAAWFSGSLEDYSYTGNFYLLVEPITSSAKLTDPTTITRTQGLPNESLFELDYPTNLIFLQSPGMTLRIAQEVHKKVLTRKVPAIWKDLRDKLAVERISLPGKGGATKIFQVSYTGENPTEVQSILETAADTFVKYSSEDRQTNIKAGVKFIDGQLPELRKRLDQLKVQQRQLRQQYELIDPMAKSQEVLSQASALGQQQLSLETQIKAQTTLYNLLQQQLNLTPEEALAASTLSQDPARIALIGQLQNLDSQMAIARATYTDGSPQLQDLEEKRQNILNLLNQTTQSILTKNALFVPNQSSALNYQDPTRLELIKQMLETANQIRVLEVQQQSLSSAKQQAEKQAARYPSVLNQYSGIQSQIDLHEELLNKFLFQREQLKVEAAQELPWQLISKPQIPLDAEGKPIGEPPSLKKKLLLGVMGGLFLGSVAALLWEKRRNIFFSDEDIPDTLNVPLLGDIPQDDRPILSSDLTPEAKLTSDPALKNPESEFGQVAALKSDFSERSPFLEAFDLLYAQLHLLQNPPLRSVVITSVEAKDGQSTVALNLAISAASAGKRVLLVDANWHEPQLHQWLNVSNHKGLSHLIADAVAPEAIVQPVPGVENLSVLTAGTLFPTAPRRLWSPRMQNIMTQLQEQYDLVIYDPPHFLNNPDVKFIAAHVDGILLVISVKKTATSSAKKAIAQMQSLNLPLLGVVANHL